MTQGDQMSDAELAREMSRLAAAIAAAASDEERQRCNSLLSEVRFELMKRGQMTLGGGCAQRPPSNRSRSGPQMVDPERTD